MTRATAPAVRRNRTSLFRLMRRSQWVDATPSLNPPSIENKSYNRLLRLDEPESCSGWVLIEYNQTEGSPAQALSNQCTGWCCIDRLSWQR
jgi:hypothetical protein